MKELSEWTEADRRSLYLFLETSTGKKLVSNCYAQVLDAALVVAADSDHAHSNGYRCGMAAMILGIVSAAKFEGEKEKTQKTINPDMGAYYDAVEV